MKQQESLRLKIATLDTRRRLLVAHLSQATRVDDLTLAKLAVQFPREASRLIPLRDELKAVVMQLTQRTHVSGRVAGAILGHLNFAVRLLAGAAQQAGLYTKHGIPQAGGRIGTIERVG
jgi:hypothetical protein